jgi:hypothetical protein
MTPLINGRSFDWSMVAVRLSNGTIPLMGITAITYEDEQEIENNYGAGNMPVSKGYGNYTASCTITVPMEEVIKIQRATESKRLQDVPSFDLVVSYIHPQLDRQVNDVIRNCDFTKNSRSLNQNDKTFPIELTLHCSHIDWDDSSILGLVNKDIL